MIWRIPSSEGQGNNFRLSLSVMPESRIKIALTASWSHITGVCSVRTRPISSASPRSGSARISIADAEDSKLS